MCDGLCMYVDNNFCVRYVERVDYNHLKVRWISPGSYSFFSDLSAIGEPL